MIVTLTAASSYRTSSVSVDLLETHSRSDLMDMIKEFVGVAKIFVWPCHQIKDKE